MLKLLSGLLALVLSGCATVGANVAEGIDAIPPGKGIVIFSTGADKTNLSFSTGMTLVQAETRMKYDKVGINIDYPFSSHFPPEHGHVRSLTLPQGDYFLIPRSGNPYFCLTKYPTYRFTVRQGVVAYIGEFSLAANRLRWQQSNRGRDVEYFLTRNPKLRALGVSPQEVIVSTESFLGCYDQTFVRGIIWEVP